MRPGSSATLLRRWRHGALAGWLLPCAVIGVLLAAVDPTSRRPSARASACASPVPGWLSERLQRPLPARQVADERTVLEAMSRSGNRAFDRHVLARVLMTGSEERYENNDTLAALDEAALGRLLQDLPVFQRLQARVRNPAAFRPPPPPPPSRPQELAPEAAPETSNDLLEALREAPKPPAPPAPKALPPPPDPYADAARLVMALRDEGAKSRALLSMYAVHPEAFQTVVAAQAGDDGFQSAFESGLGRSLTVVLQEDLAEIFRHVSVRLDQKGYPMPRLEALAAERPDELRHVIRVQLAEVIGEKPRPDWTFEVGVATLLARRDVGNYAFGTVLSSLDLTLSAFETAVSGETGRRIWSTDSPYFASQSLVQVRRCHGPVCLPPPGSPARRP
ncbi:MAG: hypothetical protein U1F52_03690 [Burkholderiales bacterium]